MSSNPHFATDMNVQRETLEAVKYTPSLAPTVSGQYSHIIFFLYKQKIWQPAHLLPDPQIFLSIQIFISTIQVSLSNYFCSLASWHNSFDTNICYMEWFHFFEVISLVASCPRRLHPAPHGGKKNKSYKAVVSPGSRETAEGCMWNITGTGHQGKCMPEGNYAYQISSGLPPILDHVPFPPRFYVLLLNYVAYYIKGRGSLCSLKLKMLFSKIKLSCPTLKPEWWLFHIHFPSLSVHLNCRKGGVSIHTGSEEIMQILWLNSHMQRDPKSISAFQLSWVRQWIL